MRRVCFPLILSKPSKASSIHIWWQCMISSPPGQQSLRSSITFLQVSIREWSRSAEKLGHIFGNASACQQSTIVKYIFPHHISSGPNPKFKMRPLKISTPHTSFPVLPWLTLQNHRHFWALMPLDQRKLYFTGILGEQPFLKSAERFLNLFFQLLPDV